MRSKLFFDNSIFWSSHEFKDSILWIKRIPSNKTILSLIEEIIPLNTNKEILSYLKTLRGNFSFVFKNKSKTIITSDRIRSSPIYFSISSSQLNVSNNYNRLLQKTPINDQLRNDSLLELKMGGFTIGDKTIVKNVYSIIAGQCVTLLNNEVSKFFYFKYFSKVENQLTKKNLIEELSETTKKIFQNYLSKLNDRQILIPLSAGNDSRLVASLLYELGARNVLCFSYGRSGNYEAKFARQIADKLGFKWIFIPNDYSDEREFYKSNLFSEYLKFSDSISSVPYFQGLSTNFRLNKMKEVQENAVFINGNSGDFISGGHIKNLNYDLNFKGLVNTYLQKHFSLWGDLINKSNIELLEHSVFNSIREIEKNVDEDNYHLCYEFLEFIDRQSKYVISGQLTYEFFNYDWELPLWDDEFLFFWRKVPEEYKINQSLYVEMLNKLNWGRVWKDIPVNKSHISPKYIIPLRFLAKIPFGIFGDRGVKEWHNFETIFFKYWTDPTNYFTFKSYFDIVKAYNRKPRNAVSFVSDDYIKSKKIN